MSDHLHQTLVLFIVNGKEQAVRTVVARPDVDVNKRAGGWGTLIEAAIIYKQHAILKFLIEERKADIRGCDGGGKTAMHYAVENNNPAALEYLIEVDDQRAKEVSGEHSRLVEVKNGDGRTPAHEAARLGHSECLQVLVDRKADLNAQDNDGNTPAHWAAFYGCEKELGILIKAGADFGLLNAKGETPKAVAKSSPGLTAGKQAAVHALLDNIPSRNSERLHSQSSAQAFIPEGT